jgi:hypothetical protein
MCRTPSCCYAGERGPVHGSLLMRKLNTLRWRKAVAVAGSVSVLALAVPRVAIAQDPARGAGTGALPSSVEVNSAPLRGKSQDVIYLRNGGVLRGTILDITPNVHARIELESGEILTVSRLDTMRIEHLAEAAPVKAIPETDDGNLREMVWVDLEGPPGARLEQDLGALQREWETACIAPCTAHLSTGFKYRVSGAQGGPSAEFFLAASNGQHELIRTRSPSKGWFVVGWVGIGAGALTLLAVAAELELPCLMGACNGSTGVDVGPALALIGGGHRGGGCGLVCHDGKQGDDSDAGHQAVADTDLKRAEGPVRI